MGEGHYSGMGGTPFNKFFAVNEQEIGKSF